MYNKYNSKYVIELKLSKYLNNGGYFNTNNNKSTDSPVSPEILQELNTTFDISHYESRLRIK